MIKLLEIFNIR